VKKEYGKSRIRTKNQYEEATSKGLQEPQNCAIDFDEWIKEKPKHKYIRLKKANESVVIRLKSSRPDSTFLSDFNGKAPKPVPVARYMVTTPEEPKEEVAFDVTSKRLAADIKAHFDKGFQELEITRLDTNPVSYRVIPMIAVQQQQ
jgi:hypothetical protein